MTDDDCRRIYNEAMELPNRNAVSVMRYIIAAYQAKLLAGAEMPEPSAYGYANERIGMYGLSLQKGGTYTEPDRIDLFTKDQLQQYAAAAAVKAREKALDEAHAKCWELAAKYEKAHHPTCEAVADECAEAIDKLKGGE